MSTRTDWGYFDKDGKPLAVGDEHHHWKCPNQEWVYDEYFEHPYTGELERIDPYPKNCPMKSIGVKLEKCTKCGVEFRYP